MHIQSRIVGGWREYYMQHGMLNLQKGRKIECKKISYELGTMISKLGLGDDEMSIDTYFQMEGEEIIELGLSTDELLDAAISNKQCLIGNSYLVETIFHDMVQQPTSFVGLEAILRGSHIL